MSPGWIGIADQESGRFSPGGSQALAGGRQKPVDAQALLPRGSLLVETRLSPEDRPQSLLAFRRTYPWAGSFALKALPGGGIFLVEAQADDMRHVTLPHAPDGRTDMVRLSYSWDAPEKWGRLTLERPETDLVHSVDIRNPHPMPLAELSHVFVDPRRRELDPDVSFFALSERPEPVGPMPGLTGQVPVSTPSGFVPAGLLNRGDLVLTAEGSSVPVLHRVSRVVPARGSFRPVLLRAPYFGLRQDILVAPQQRLVMSGTQVEYMFGREAVLVPARHLVNGVSARYAEGPDLVEYHGLLLPGHEAIIAAGCQMESLYIGRLRRKPASLAASVLTGLDRNSLPEHPRPMELVLKPFEAITLAMSRAA